ncbi:MULTISPECIES: UDP-N-acetylglucosamine 2-epimerase [Methylomonas]|uniref:UDP-N-acetyl glucosamine 2-epimerase n=2 Tax=Methylomonas TaxID=416 RepID=A0A126T6Q5_9GAMM|nr:MULTISPECIES: UDP-N-acetylglucosamine 2-epimerase [Methylomonas]AMK77763.1 UDP-N-acetyl glucosamine 2-epimerase [Methylomonas denitrificans]OAI08655.1 UDP-N-acetyl glucosamine 2-epimerase [Methylomonas methanica]TCV86936.1 GDP/UDP-N,N'-diacetylbacillosamine 2-epimerase (hydrolysing) [Methylomonas methanica]
MATAPRKICVVTGSRAEYGLLYWLLREIEADAELELQLIVTGMHLSSEFGLTWRQIAADGFTINRKVEMLLSSDTPVGISKAMGLALIGFADALHDLQPDILVVLGDRFEIFAAVQAAMNQRLPIAHIHGGELTEGAVDDAIRHAITKMAHLHFTSTEIYRQRVIQLGEQPERVFNVGAPGLDNVYRLPLLDKERLEQALDFKFGKRNLLVTFHPATLENATATQQFEQLLQALDTFDDVHIIFTHANADADGRAIAGMIEDYRQRHVDRVTSFVSMGSLRYLSTLKLVDAVVGNSSSGILEAPAFKIATVNIGDRQRGRICADSVLHCSPHADAIREALLKVFSGAFANILAAVENPHGRGGASLKIKDLLKQTPLDGLLKKHFYDLKVGA